MTKKELKKILESGGFTMLYFYNSTCGHCKQLTPKVKLFESKYKYNFHSINTFENEEISNLFKVDWVPVLMVIEEGKLRIHDGVTEIKKFLS